MKLMILVLNNDDYLDKIMEQFRGFQLSGATIISSQGMYSFLHDISGDHPFVRSLQKWTASIRSENKTIFTVIEDDLVEPLYDAVEKIIGTLNEPGSGIAFTLPIDSVRGFKHIK